MSFSGQSNPPWQRNNLNNVLQGGQIVGGGAASIGQLSNAGLPFHQGGAAPHMFLQQQAQQNLSFGHEPLQNSNIFQGNTTSISYPQSRSGLNPVAFQNSAGSGQLQQQSQNRSQQQQHYNSIGTVTKINSECGLVNEEVLFYRNVCKGHIPKLGDRVLFEASFSQNGQFKWNATRVQMMPQPGINSSQPPPLMGSSTKGSGYNAVPPPNEYQQRQQQRRGASPPRRASPGRDRHARSERDRERTHRSRDRDDDEHDRKRRREDRSRTSNVVSRSDRERDRDRDDSKREHDQSRERDREREMERERDRDKEREKSPTHRSGAKTRKTRNIRRYLVQIPKTLLTFKRADIQELRQRYSTLYIPSDFFHANIKWSDSFTHNNPFSLHRPCQFHIMHRIVEPLNDISKDRAEPEDANYKFSAKVMLMSCPPIAELYQKCFEDDENEQHTVHPSRLISFLVGTRGRNEPMAIGGAWSPSLDGENPDKDPSVLIRTAIRTCKSLTGIDLSNCTQWYRFVELYYHRTDHKNKDKEISPQIETVVIYLPDIHACIPTVSEWENLTQGYKAAVENVISRKQLETLKASSGEDAAGSATLANDCNKETTTAPADTPADTEAAKEDINTSDPEITIIAEDSKEDEEDDSPQPTHYSQLDLKAMKVQDIRNELIARNLPSKGVRNLIMARLAKALNTEKAEELNRTKDRSEADVEIIDCDSEEGVKNQNENDENSDLKNNVDDKDDEHDEHEDWADVDMNDIVILDEYDSSKNPEEGLSKEFDEREKSQILRRYTLPNTPHVIVHPSKTAKGGKFDCSIMSLSVLLDYRPEDTKERFFEVSLFAELFNEMLMRDFGFNIYKELFLQRESNSAELDAAAEETTTNNKKDDTKSIDDEEKSKDSNGAIENKQDNSNAEKKKDRRVSKQSADVDPEDDSQSIKSSADRKRKTFASASKKKMIVVKPQLLLSFVYFDTSHCGYIFEKDLEDLFSILGLSLSRGQIRKVLGKSASRQAFYYRKLTDKEESIEVLPAIEELDDIAIEDVRKIALGNKQYFPIFKTEANEEDNIASGVTTTQANNDLISYNGAVIHVGKLIEQIKRTEKKFSDLEKFYNDLRKQNTDLQKEHSKSSSKIKELQSEAKGLNRKLSDTDQDLYTINRKYKDQQATLSYIYHRVSPYFNRDKDHKSENSRDKDHDKHKEKDNEKSKDNKEKDKSQVKKEEKERKNNDTEKIDEAEKDKPDLENENDVEMEKEAEEEEDDNNVKEFENEN